MACVFTLTRSVRLCSQTIIPIGLRDRRQASTGVPDYTDKTNKQLNTTIIFDPTVGVNGSKQLSCAALQADLPNGEHHSQQQA